MSSSRRRFLGLLGSSSVLGATGFPSLAHAAASEASAAHPAPLAETFDMSWTEKVKGKYRAVFDSPEHADGAALFRAVAWCDMYKDVYGVERGEMSPVVVFRHAGINMIMGNAYWEQYEVGKGYKMRNEQGKKWATANPISTGGGDAKGPMAKYKLETYLAGGGVVLACNWAFAQVVGNIRRREKIEMAAARTRALELMVPGVILQPNGIFAALRAQEAGCHYVLAS